MPSPTVSTRRHTFPARALALAASVAAAAIAPTHDAQGALLLVHKDRWGASAEVRRRWEELSDDWLPIFVSGDQRMVVLAHESALDGESLPAAAGWWRTSSAGGEMVRRGTCGVSPYEPSG